VAALLLCCATAPAAANPCAFGGAPYPDLALPGDDEGGIGGTGHQGESEAAGGIGGTGHSYDDGGLGGTGIAPDAHAAAGDEGGIGGTGIDMAQPQTGILGTITGFASICVGGTEIHYDVATPTWIDGHRVSVSDLAVGQVVEVLAVGRGSVLRAAEIHAAPIVAGPVTAVAANRLEVVGQRIDLAATTRTDTPDRGSDGAFALGTQVQVFGLRRADGSIDASRIERAAGSAVLLRGPLDQSPAGGAHMAIAGTTVDLPGDVDATAGAHVSVRGSWRDGVLVADTVRIDAAPAFLDRVTRVEVEAYARDVGRGLDVGGFVVGFDHFAGAASLVGQRVKLTAEVDAMRRVTVRALVPARPRAAALPRVDRPDDAMRGGASQSGPPPGPGHAGQPRGHRPAPNGDRMARPPQRAGGVPPRPPLVRPPHLHRPPVQVRPAPPRPPMPRPR